MLLGTCRYLQIEYFLRAAQEDSHVLPVVMPVGIAAVDQGIALVLRVAGIVAGEADDIARHCVASRSEAEWEGR